MKSKIFNNFTVVAEPPLSSKDFKKLRKLVEKLPTGKYTIEKIK